MKTKISVEGIECYAFHGCLEAEGAIGGEYLVDVSFELNADKAIAMDDLSATVDYVIVNKIVREQMAIRSLLIEHVAGRIMDSLNVAFPIEMTVEVRVRKYNPPVNTQLRSASVTLIKDFK